MLGLYTKASQPDTSSPCMKGLYLVCGVQQQLLRVRSLSFLSFIPPFWIEESFMREKSEQKSGWDTTTTTTYTACNT